MALFPTAYTILLICSIFFTRIDAAQFPYTRVFTNGSTPAGEENHLIPDLFVRWLASHPSGALQNVLHPKAIESASEIRTLSDLHNVMAHHHVHRADLPSTVWDGMSGFHRRNMTDAERAGLLFSHLEFELAPECISRKENYWYRSANGACNWLKKGESHLGSTFQPRSRDFNQHSYADGISQPREGPNPRELSNAFFKRKERLHYQHTPLMLGLVEWLMHDVSYSEDIPHPHGIGLDGPSTSQDFIDVPIPAGDEAFDPRGHGNRSFHIHRTKPAAGTGTSKENPREHENGATAWLDASALYGSTEDVGRALRSFKDGKLKAQIGKDKREYLPYNTGLKPLDMRTRPGVDASSLFMGGDARTNEDWIMLSLHTLFLREHNRVCDILRVQHFHWNDEQLYQTARLVVGGKLAMIGNAYQMAYWKDDMPAPRDDGFPLYRAMYGASAFEINPFHAYPWSLVTRGDRPMVPSAEMAIVYRFHELIINSFPLKDEHNNTIKEMSIFGTGFDSRGFLENGADAVLRGMVSTDIPNFKSGVDESFRSAGKYRGAPLDLVVWSIVHEREQGLPTFNDYWRAYAAMKPEPSVKVKIRETFEDFTSDPSALSALKRLYKSPDEVDLVVGVQLDETYFPGTTMPTSALIPSLFSLFGVGNSDRFSPGFAIMRCIIVDKPWDCHPSNALEDLLWKPDPTDLFPYARSVDEFWANELDLPAQGQNLLFRLITENSGTHCVQKNPLFPYDPDTNPILCELIPSTSNLWSLVKIYIRPLLSWTGLIKNLRSPLVDWKTAKLFFHMHVFRTLVEAAQKHSPWHVEL